MTRVEYLRVSGKGPRLMENKEKAPKRKYPIPTITRVKLQDKPVVAMAVCKTGPTNRACADDFGSPSLNFNAS